MSDFPDMAQRVHAVLDRMGSISSVAELHGELVGLLCVKGTLTQDEWFARAAAEGEVELAQDERETLSQLHGDTVRQLNDPVLDFQPLLPDEAEPLIERVEALSEWCQGFLLGLSEGGVHNTESLPADAAEIMGDLVNISRADNYELSNSEDDEEAYAELLEYVRAGVLLVNEELNPTQAAPRGLATLH